MAINNGNTDFKLYVFQEGTNDQKIRIQFTPYNDIVSANPN
ncbi:hypothetical protein [Alkaliphilus sp. B6464]|nr:hypothetical protein [Alkaliphilus sp. B6464]